MRTFTLTALVAAALLVAGAAGAQAPDTAALRQAVWNTEQAFARSMADRDHAAFTSFLSNEAVFFAGEEPTRGKTAIAEQWRPFFDGPTPPFRWEPELVVVLASGTLALSTGPVYDSTGRMVARFNSIWRLETPNGWKIVFDKGSSVCTC
jgi:ketosteroid isomerase-like protein